MWCLLNGSHGKSYKLVCILSFMNERLSALGWIVVIIVFFVVASYLVQDNLLEIKERIGGVPGMGLYVFILIVAVVLAPVSALPLIPLVSPVYGWFVAGLLSIIGWTIGASIAFLLARRYGTGLVQKVVSLNKIKKFEKKIPQKNMFWSIVFLRMTIPVDILSYALGLFSSVSFGTYFFATLVGVTPFAFIFAYLGEMPVYYQITGLIAAGIIFLVGLVVMSKRKKHEEKGLRK